MDSRGLLFAFAFAVTLWLSPTHAVGITPNYDNGTYKFFDLRAPLFLHCNSSSTERVQWFKNDKPLSEDSSLGSRFEDLAAEKSIVIKNTNENDGGNYTCKIGGESANIVVVAKPTARLPANTGVVEGEKLRLHCITHGNPRPIVEWIIGNDTYTESTGRITLSNESDVVNAVLVMDNVTMDDRGDYKCRARNVANDYLTFTASATTFVRVKDSLAALWPFLGICAEVFVLCAIILIYEKRRSKPEIDESDTDQSPDQKHTPDHGKGGDVRHRK